VGILGAGYSHVPLDSTGDTYVTAMDSLAVHSLSGWSSHAWEWNTSAINQEGGQSYMRSVWPYQMASYKAKDPLGQLPIFVTEYSTDASVFHGQPTPTGTFAADRPPFAARVFENTLSLLNGGANVLVYWQGADQSWAPTNPGLITDAAQGGTPRPVYYALKTLCARLRPYSRVLQAIKQDTSIYSAAFLKENRLVIAMVNSTSSSRTKTVQISGITKMKLVESVKFLATDPLKETISTSGIVIDYTNMKITATIPTDSTVTLSFNVAFAPNSQANVAGQRKLTPRKNW